MRIARRASIAALLLAMSLAGCANPYEKFYQGAADGRTVSGYIATTEPLKIFSTDDFERDRLALMRQGYIQVGASSFNAGSNSVSENQLRAQAAKVGAAAVLVASKYTGTVTGALPLTLPNSSTSYTTGSATAYGAGGPVTAYGSATTTTYGSTTTMVPYSIARSDFGAAYFVKQRTRLGIFPETLDDETRKRLETNSGVRVKVVIDASPAFLADILPGDILLTLNGEGVQSPTYLTQILIPKYNGQPVTITLNRDGKVLEKKVTLNSI